MKIRDKQWDYKFLSCNPNITLKEINSIQINRWDYKYLLINPNITMEDVKYNPNIGSKL